MSESQRTLTRAERRQRSEERILSAARDLFAERGFDRATIRAIAARAGVDPALVMQRFGSKQDLFRRAADTAYDDHGADDPDRLLDLLVTMTGAKLSELPETSQTLLRSALTHPEAADQVRASQSEHLRRIAESLPGEDADLRASMIIALMIGVTMERQLIGLEPLRDADPDRVIELMRSCFEVLTRG